MFVAAIGGCSLPFCLNFVGALLSRIFVRKLLFNLICTSFFTVAFVLSEHPILSAKYYQKRILFWGERRT